MNPKLTRREALLLLGGATLATLHSGCSTARPIRAGSGAPPVEPMHYRPLTDVARLLESREISPVDLTEHMLARIESVDVRLHGYFTVSADRARQAARRAEEEIRQGRYRGPLHGVPVAVKDLCQTKGLVTTGGLSFLRDNVPAQDATVVARLEAAGAVLLGKLAMTEGAMAGYHRDFPIPAPPTLHDMPTGNYERVVRALEDAYGLKDLKFDFEVLLGLQDALRQGEWTITVTIWQSKEIVKVEPGHVDVCYGLAVDVGTTTCVGYLCDLSTGKVLNTESMMNPQVPYGEDVMSRITYAMSTLKVLRPCRMPS